MKATSGGRRSPIHGPSAEPDSLIERIRARKKPLLITVVLIAGLAFAAGWNPPTTKSHEFTSSSDYNARRESGCTNSGKGCHGSDDTLSDFNKYHPDTPCTTCHEYTGVGCIPCHGPAQHECTGCHDGTMKGATDCVRLSDPYPKGHYRATLHAAMGTDMKQVVRSAKDGDAQATCANCHSRDLKAAHTKVPVADGSKYGIDVGCAECHNDAKSGSLRQVQTKWKKHRCEDCHGEKSQAPMHAVDIATAAAGTGELGCGETGAGCHSGNDIHALHPDAPESCSGSAADGEPGCHDLELQSAEATVTACGSGEGTCHTPYRNDRYAHKNDSKMHNAGTAQANAPLTDAKTGISITCSSCHSMDIGTGHARTLGKKACDRCHNKSAATIRAVKDSWPSRGTTKACATCHTGILHANTGVAHIAIQLDASGNPSQTACVASGCHATPDVRALHTRSGCTTSGCHTASGMASTIMTCGGTAAQAGASCHAGVHASVDTAHVAAQYDDSGRVSPGACVNGGCHPTADVRTLHTAVGGCATAGCHDKTGPTYMACGGTAATGSCHVKRHPTFGPAHASVAIPDTNACGRPGCHPTLKLADVHASRGCNIAGCHTAATVRPVLRTCGGSDTSGNCHTQSTAHPRMDSAHASIELNNANVRQPGACGCHFRPGVDATDVRYVRTVTAPATTTSTPAHGCISTPGCHLAGGPYSITCGGTGATTSCHSGGPVGRRPSAACIIPVLPAGTTELTLVLSALGSAAPMDPGPTPVSTETSPAAVTGEAPTDTR